MKHIKGSYLTISDESKTNLAPRAMAEPFPSTHLTIPRMTTSREGSLALIQVSVFSVNLATNGIANPQPEAKNELASQGSSSLTSDTTLPRSDGLVRSFERMLLTAFPARQTDCPATTCEEGRESLTALDSEDLNCLALLLRGLLLGLNRLLISFGPDLSFGLRDGCSNRGIGEADGLANCLRAGKKDWGYENFASLVQIYNRGHQTRP